MTHDVEIETDLISFVSEETIRFVTLRDDVHNWLTENAQYWFHIWIDYRKGEPTYMLEFADVEDATHFKLTWC